MNDGLVGWERDKEYERHGKQSSNVSEKITTTQKRGGKEVLKIRKNKHSSWYVLSIICSLINNNLLNNQK